MAFVVEDGDGLELANAYVAVAFVDTYHEDRGRTDWAGFSTAIKEDSIVRATDYIEWRFGTKFRGTRRGQSQGLEWPRISAFDNDDFLYNNPLDAVPRQLQKATAEYALIAARQGELAPNPPLPTGDETLDGTASTATENTSGIVTAKRERVGPLEEETKYADLTSAGSSQAGGRTAQSFMNSDFYLPEYPRADGWIRELIDNPNSRRLLRG